MSQYFAYDYTGAPFVLFGTWHLVALLFIVLLNVGLLGFRKSSEKTRTAVRWTIAIVLWADEASWHIWNAYWGHWTVKTMLPLHLCSVLIWLAGFMLIFKNYRIYEFVYFLGIGGALQSLLTPDAGIYGFPHYRIFQTMISHGLLVTSGIFMTTVEGFRPTWKSILRVAIVANIYLVIIYFVNVTLGSNYMMLNGKPATASLLDALPAWPYYIPFLELIGVVTCLLLYAPFIIKDWRAKVRAKTA
ncbi:MAG: TIGR02206 family membrane protein [Chloroflexi bacterium]|nr:TIGR02206 family membrane protein [Chloroflexota bacterium]